MVSKWFKYKSEAILLRRKGLSIRAIEVKLGIPRSTLSGWFKDIKLTQAQKKKLYQNWLNALVKARKKAVLWHNTQKTKRIKQAENEAIEILKNLDVSNKYILELALAILYLGEGSKANEETALGSSDPEILKFFLVCIEKIYNFNVRSIRCELYLRADQNAKKMKKFWAEELNLPLECFKQTNFDKRTIGFKTYENYKGVCNLRCANVAIQRRLLFLSKKFCEKSVNLK